MHDPYKRPCLVQAAVERRRLQRRRSLRALTRSPCPESPTAPFPAQSPAGMWPLRVGLIVVGLLCGCGSEDGPKRIPVHGTVEWSAKAVPDGSISFLPAEGLKGPAANAPIIEGGYDFTSENGPSPGPHRAVIGFVPPKSELLQSAPTGRGSQGQSRTKWEFDVVIPDEGSFEKSFTLE